MTRVHPRITRTRAREFLIAGSCTRTRCGPWETDPRITRTRIRELTGNSWVCEYSWALMNTREYTHELCGILQWREVQSSTTKY